MRDALVICTKDRPDDLERCLATVAAQGVRPSRTLVVDASQTSAAEKVASCFDGVEYLRAPAGLTRQRNAGVAHLGQDVDVVHFVDDDVLLAPGYVVALRTCFENPLVLGAGGIITNAPPHRPGLFRRAFMLDTQRVGAVLPSGVNVLGAWATVDTAVDWLSGCSMSYRRCVFDRLAFDESLTGYALGEDVDFGLAVRELGLLVVTPEARLRHENSPLNRLSRFEFDRDAVVSRYRRVKQHPGRLSTRAFWWSILGELGLALAKSAFLARRASLMHGWATAAGCTRIMRGQTEIPG